MRSRYSANWRVFGSALFALHCGSTCHDYTEQTIWDGDQVLGEIRDASGGFQQEGTVAYTHGGGLDAPLSLVRKGILASGAVTIIPHSNWRGQYHAGSYTDGAVAGNSRLDLREVRWPAENAGAYLNPMAPSRRDAPWMGSLVQSSEDASGLMYRRNRYFDPKTGRFTQEDPIGLAGGLNTYGFADGDPVSYDDPYGLRADDDCRKVACPKTPREVADNRKVQQFAQELMVASLMDSKGVEYGGFIVRGKDGSLSLTNVTRGEVGSVSLGVAPDNAIARIHTHPDHVDEYGRIPFENPSGPDASNANRDNVYGVVVTPRNFHIVPIGRNTYQSFSRTQTLMPPAPCGSRTVCASPYR